MKHIITSLILGVSLLCSAAPVIRIEAENLAGDSKTGSLYHFSGGKNAGKWKELSGSVEIPEAGTWSVWIRCSASWKHYLKYAPLAKAQQLRHFAMDINGKTLKFDEFGIRPRRYYKEVFRVSITKISYFFKETISFRRYDFIISV